LETQSITELMLPVEKCGMISEDDTLYDAFVAMDKINKDLVKTTDDNPHRAILVCDKSKQVVGKINHTDLLRALEPKYEQMGDAKVLSRAGFSPEFLKSIQTKYSLWDNPLRDICNKAVKNKAKNIMHIPSKSEYIDESASIDEAVHQLVMGSHQSLLVLRDKKVVGVIRLADMIKNIFKIIKSCET